ncbi:MAG: hypothetical protein ABFS32_18735 [Bacteroidota bacterium]
MINSDSYSVKLKIHRLMGYLIGTTVVYLSAGIFLCYLFYISNKNQYLVILLFTSIAYLIIYTSIAIVFRRLIKVNNVKERTLMNYLVFSF